MRIKDGQVIIFPTDTVYGMGAKVTDDAALERMMHIKRRSANKTFAVLCDSMAQIEELAYVDERARIIIDNFMPGALTLILKSKLSHRNLAIKDTIGVRIPNHEFALKLLRENGPLATTSVNISKEMPLNDYESIVFRFNDMVDYIYDDPCKKEYSNISSTVVDLTKDEMVVLREGQIKIDDIISMLEKNV